jgi:hypothetical protein
LKDNFGGKFNRYDPQVGILLIMQWSKSGLRHSNTVQYPS